MPFLAATSFGYLLTVAPGSVCALLAWSLVVFFAAPATRRGRSGRLWLLFGLILAVIAFLAAFKYVPDLVRGLLGDGATARVAIPLGISYYAFKLIHYLAEVSRGNLEAHSLGQFLCFMLLFPIFSAGPIERFDHFLAARERRWSADSAVEGLTRIVHGLIKKFTVALLLSGYLDGAGGAQAFLAGLVELPVANVWLYVAATYLYIYFDFSAYSDIVIGCSLLYGLRIGENFDFPLVAANIRDYWRRWHMSLSGWCQSYVYMPVIGLSRQPLLALYSTFFVMGMWHAATPQRLAWGLYHATGVALFTAWNRLRRRRGWSLHPWIERPLGISMTQAFVCGSMTFLITDPEGGLWGALRILLKLVFIELPA
jgi:alginate O-acetyltransferase complex protein AlgI